MSLVTNKCVFLMAAGQLDLDADDIRCALVTSSYTENRDHNFMSDITNELSGGNYSRQALAGESVTEDDTNDWAKFDANDRLFAALQAAAGTPAKAIIFKFVTTDADSPMLASLALTSPPVPNGGDYTIVFGTNGLITFASA